MNAIELSDSSATGEGPKGKYLDVKKRIAWGAGPLFELFLDHAPDHGLDYCLDRSPTLNGKTVKGVPILPPDRLDQEERGEVFVLITATSSSAIGSIHTSLSERGFVFDQDYSDLAWMLKDSFKAKAVNILGKALDDNGFVYAHSFNFNSHIPLETTILGNWFILEALEATRNLKGAVAEVGAFQGGNAYLQLSAMALRGDQRTYYVLDSFEGFPPLSEYDPVDMQAVYRPEDFRLNRIINGLRQFRQAMVIPGFVPGTFRQIPAKERFSLVFYDCDLYQPALDTYAYFWERLEPGGMIIIHDNVATPRGWNGVRKATNQFFDPLSVPIHDLWETTMSVVQK
jgi:hypothetical protein